tara:strand:+ start:1152 stop:2216 length:1065 start_codon:yes stop_codon:yes gene_type:complete
MANFIFDADSRHQHYIERYKTGTVNDLGKFLVLLEDKLIARLSKSKTFTSRKRILSVLKQIEKDAFGLLSQYTEQLGVDLESFSKAESEFVASTLAKAAETETFTVASTAALRAAANARPFATKLLREELKDFPREQAKYIRNQVALGFAEGKSNPQIIKDVVGSADQKFKDGSMQVTRNAASRMTRTSVQHMAAIAREETYKRNSDIISEYAWISVLDSRTSSICQKRDQQVYKVGKGPLPPAHPNCRSTITPVFAGETKKVEGIERLDLDNGLRPDKDSKGVGKTNVKNDYNSWLGRQSKQFQIDALGKSKAELFRKGGLSVNKFVDRLDRPLTLDQLKRTYPTAWERAELT